MSRVSPLPTPRQQPVSPPAANPNQRLVIQETGDAGVFVYTLLDRTTGQVLTQLPCETVLDMAGQVVGASA